MGNHNQHNRENGNHTKSTRGFGAGLLVGGLAGAGALLLIASIARGL